jgi:hypothetical protein
MKDKYNQIYSDGKMIDISDAEDLRLFIINMKEKMPALSVDNVFDGIISYWEEQFNRKLTDREYQSFKNKLKEISSVRY